jgi:hypothetical protein
MWPRRCGPRQMIALDTNILARFCVDDPGDPEAAGQRLIARAIMTDSPGLFVPLTVVLARLRLVDPDSAGFRRCGAPSTLFLLPREYPRRL